MNLLKIDITPDQKKIIIISCVVLFVFLLLWVFLYLPSLSQIKNLKNEFVSTQKQIQAIETLLVGPQGRDEAIRLLKQKQQYLTSGFPQKEDQSLRFIPEIARKMNIQVISLNPGSKTEFLDESGRQVIIEGKAASYLPISMEVSCYYKDLVKYLLDLKSNLPAFISVMNLNVQKENQLSGKVRANLEFNLYLLI